jgi:arsenite oxidase small subunit
LATAEAFHSTEPTTVQKVGEVDRMKIGQATTFGYPTANDPCILVRLSETKFVAYSQKCTHLTCPVYYDPGKNHLECPCHEGAFAVTTGAVLGGPPQRPLPKILLRIDSDGAIYAIGVDTNLAAGQGE